MTISYDTGGQISTDGTGTISGTLAANASAEGIIAFVLSKGTNADQLSGVTADGISMERLGRIAIDSATETGRVDAFFLGKGANNGGSQTISLTVSGAATKRLYAASLLCSAGNQLALYRRPIIPGDTYELQAPPNAAASSSGGTGSAEPFNSFYGQAYFQGNESNPSATFAIPANRTVFGLGAMYYGGNSTGIAVTAGSTEIAEANFSGNVDCGTFLRCNNPVNNGNLTMGWTSTADDTAALWVGIEEVTPISGVYEDNGTPVSGAYVSIMIMDSVGALWRPYDIVTTDGSGNWSSRVPVGCKWVAVPFHTASGDTYTAKPWMNIT